MEGKCVKFLIAMVFFCLTLSAVVFSCLTVASCEFITYQDPDDASARMTAGLFKFQVGDAGDACVTYSDSEVDSLTNLEKTAMVCGFLAPCFGIVALALAALELFLCDKCCIGCFVSLLFSFATISQSLTFLFLRSDSFCSFEPGCTMGDGAIYSIVAVSVLFVAGCTLGCIPKSDPLLLPNTDQETVYS